MTAEPARSKRGDYRLDLEVDGALLRLHVDGPEGPTLRQHVAEVRRAAELCGLHLVVNDGSPDGPGMPV